MGRIPAPVIPLSQRDDFGRRTRRRSRGIREIISQDRGFDAVDGIRRIDPAEATAR